MHRRRQAGRDMPAGLGARCPEKRRPRGTLGPPFLTVMLPRTLAAKAAQVAEPRSLFINSFYDAH